MKAKTMREQVRDFERGLREMREKLQAKRNIWSLPGSETDIGRARMIGRMEGVDLALDLLDEVTP